MNNQFICMWIIEEVSYIKLTKKKKIFSRLFLVWRIKRVNERNEKEIAFFYLVEIIYCIFFDKNILYLKISYII